jgi:outer membrane protein assembly factor BamB
MNAKLASKAIPAGLAMVGAAALSLWIAVESQQAKVGLRLPGDDNEGAGLAAVVVDIKGTFTPGEGKPADWEGSWPWFRGAGLDNISTEQGVLARSWKPTGPPKLWSIEVGEGYAGPAIHKGRVYLLDYDQKKLGDVLRCLSLADGKEIWQRFYAVDIGRNHGITRTVPAVTDKYVVTLGPKCQVMCADAISGDFVWGIDLVREHKTTVPPWYAGQCPLIDGDRVILAPGGTSLLMAAELATGKVVWKTENPKQWKMTHSSVVPITFGGTKMYVYAASGGVVGVSAEDGKLLWETAEWKVNMANVPTPVPMGDDRIFLSGGYGAGSMMIRLNQSAGGIVVENVYRLKPEVFGAEQHTPVLYKGFLYGLIPPTGRPVCLDPAGKRKWISGAKERFGLGPFMVAEGMLIVLDEKGKLVLAEATEAGYKPIAAAYVIEDANEAWGPLALAGGRLIVRDMTRLVCLDLRKVANE